MVVRLIFLFLFLCLGRIGFGRGKTTMYPTAKFEGPGGQDCVFKS